MQTQQLDDIIAPAVKALGFDYVGCEQHQQVVRVYIDKPQGVTVDDCEKASKQIGAVLDVEDPIAGRYRLEVSSPGVERPLFNAEQFARFVGRTAKVKITVPFNGQRNFIGTITKVTDDDVTLAVGEEAVCLPIASMAKAHLVEV